MAPPAATCHPYARLGALAVALATLGGCASAPDIDVAALTTGASDGDRPDCTVMVPAPAGSAEAAGPGSIQAAVDRAAPGDVICVAAGERPNERVTVTRSGTAAAPIWITALGEVTTAGFVIRADHVVVAGFTVIGRTGEADGHGMGLYLEGTGVQALDNHVIDSEGVGIGCNPLPASCFDTVIAGNRVQGADGTGILVSGAGILVARNEVTGSRMIDANDADGIRFFGAAITIRENYVHDISDAGFPDGEEPHTDCFQTFDNHKPTTLDVVIEDNVCDNVDHQCLIAEAPERGESARLQFRRNLCANNGSQGVLVRDLQFVEITDNTFMSSIVYTGVVLRQGATNATIEGNTFIGSIRAYEVDATSMAGLHADRNRVHHATRATPPDWWAEPNGVWGTGQGVPRPAKPAAIASSG